MHPDFVILETVTVLSPTEAIQVAITIGISENSFSKEIVMLEPVKAILPNAISFKLVFN